MDEMLRELLFHRFRLKKYSFDFLEGLLAVCVTGVGFMLRTSFGAGLPRLVYLFAEWYLAFVCAVLVFRWTSSGRKALLTYGILWILPTAAADGAILRGNACIGTLLFVCALLFFQKRQKWLFTIAMAVLLFWSVKYFGLLFACVVLWQKKELKLEQLLLLLAAGGLRFVYTYRLWFGAGYTLTTFHWPNVYEIVGREAIRGQWVDPIAVVGLGVALGVLLITVYLFRFGELKLRRAALLRVFLFFGLLAGFFLPYMDQTFGYLFCVLGVVYFVLEPGQFLVPMLLQVVTFAGYQECVNGESMMPMTFFAAAQFLVIAFLSAQIFQEMGMIRLWNRKN